MKNNIKNTFFEIFKNDIEKIINFINRKKYDWICYKKIDFISEVPDDYLSNSSEYSILFNFIKLLLKKYKVIKIYKASKGSSPDFVIIIEKNNFYEYVGLEVTQFKDITGFSFKNLIPIDTSENITCKKFKSVKNSLRKHYSKISLYKQYIKVFFNSNNVDCYLAIDSMSSILDSPIYLDFLEKFAKDIMNEKVFIAFQFPIPGVLHRFSFSGKCSFQPILDFINSFLYKEYYYYLKYLSCKSLNY